MYRSDVYTIKPCESMIEEYWETEYIDRHEWIMIFCGNFLAELENIGYMIRNDLYRIFRDYPLGSLFDVGFDSDYVLDQVIEHVPTDFAIRNIFFDGVLIYIVV